jgi:hypothetical protein
MTDKELLELAAKAAGIELDWDVPPKSPPWRMTGTGEDKGPAAQWTPLTDDGDLFRLAQKLNIVIDFNEGFAEHWSTLRHHFGDNGRTVHHAVLQVAAEIGFTA